MKSQNTLKLAVFIFIINFYGLSSFGQLIAHWDFNETSGTVLNDISGNGHDGTISNANWGNGNLCFDGQNSEVEIPYSPVFSNLNELTVEAIFKVNDLPAVNDYSRIIAVWDQFNGFNSNTHQAFALSIQQTNDGVMLSLIVRTGASTAFDGTGVTYTFQDFPLDQWLKVRGVVDNGHYYLYLDDNLLADNDVYDPAIIKEAITPLTIGYSVGTNNNNDPVNTHFNGCIDDIKIWNEAIHPNPAEDLIAHWDFNETSGTVLNDISGNGHDGTISNANWGNGNLCFDGQNSEVEIPYSPVFSNLNELTVEAIFKVNDLPAVNDYSRIIAVWDQFNGFNSNTHQAFALSIQQTNDGVMLSLIVRTGASTAFDGTGVTYTFQDFPLDQWLKVRGVVDNGHYYLYLDDNLLADNDVYDPAIIKEAITPLTIGYSVGTNNNNDPVNTHFNGCIDDIKIWNEAIHPILSVNENLITLSDQLMLEHYPNPTNGYSNIKFQLSKVTYVNLSLYNILGEEVSQIVNKEMPAGEHILNYNLAGLKSGTYIYLLRYGNSYTTKKVVLFQN